MGDNNDDDDDTNNNEDDSDDGCCCDDVGMGSRDVLVVADNDDNIDNRFSCACGGCSGGKDGIYAVTATTTVDGRRIVPTDSVSIIIIIITIGIIRVNVK